MSEAARLAETLAGPEWILALEQTQARGRRGRAWSMPKGNFAATLVMRPPGTPAEAALRTFTASLALAEAFDKLTGRVRAITLKWPNDVLLHGGKVAGILLESLPHGVLTIGFGVNLAAAPAADQVEPGAVPPVSLAGDSGLSVTPEEMLDLLAPAFAAWEEKLTTWGFEGVRNAWLNRAARLGQEITARTGTETRVGTFETIDANGHLVMTSAGHRIAIPAADVFF